MDRQLLIIGNGFDLQCGLKSSYSDFYLAEIVKGYSLFNEFDYLKKNFWQTLLFYYPKSEYGWCDIERIIQEALHLIYDNSDGLLQLALDIKAENVSEQFVHQYEPYKRFICDYCYYYFGSSFPSLSVAAKALSDELLKQLKEFEQLFCSYLKNQIKDNEIYKLNAINLLLKLTYPSHQPISSLDNSELASLDFRKAHIISFNYTSPFEMLQNRIGSYNRVHGKLCENDCEQCKGSSIIFGIDDKSVKEKDKNTEKEKINIYLRDFSKTYRTLFLNEIQNNVLPICDRDNPLIIKFYGHSLNEADYSYFQSIFDYYDLYDNGNVSLEFYYSPFKEDVVNEVTDAVYNLVNEYGQTLSNKDQGKNLMHKLILEHRVRIKEIN